MARKFKTTLIAAMLVDDTGEIRRNDQPVEGWSVTKKTATIDGINFDPWQPVFVDLMGEFTAADRHGGQHKFFRSVTGADGNPRPLVRSDVREGRM